MKEVAVYFGRDIATVEPVLEWFEAAMQSDREFLESTKRAGKIVEL
jgi:hypothetical protein